jgi:5,10-methylenetetrahydrofolate reductase
MAMKMKIPDFVKKKLEGLTDDKVQSNMKTIENAIDDIYNEKASNMNYKNLYEYVMNNACVINLLIRLIVLPTNL